MPNTPADYAASLIAHHGEAEARAIAQSILALLAEVAPEPAWRTLKPEVQEQLAMDKIEEVCECAKEIAHSELDGMSLEELARDVLRSDLDEEPTDEQVAAWIAENVATEAE